MRGDFGTTKVITHRAAESTTCVQCGTTFTYQRITRPRTRCDQCGADRAYALERAHRLGPIERRPKEPEAKTCAHCNEWFVTAHGHKVYCSLNCCHLSSKRNRRARKRATNPNNDIIRLGQLIERDEFICHICGIAVDVNARVPDYNAPTIDHVVPLSQGGAHTLDNVKLAHFICNTRKSDHAPI